MLHVFAFMYELCILQEKLAYLCSSYNKVHQEKGFLNNSYLPLLLMG